ncbi:hypothetical protein Tco_0762456 [Tanacetum coccineum]
MFLCVEFPSAKELKDTTNCHWVVAHVTPPSWKQHLREISIEQLCDIHDKAYMRQAVLDNVLNGKTRELISALHKAMASCDTMWEKEIKKDKAVTSMASTEVDSLRKDRVVVVSRVIPDAAMKLIHRNEMGVLIAKLVKAFIIYARCTAFEEVATLKKPFVLEEMPGYCPSSKEEAIAVEEAAVTSIKAFVFKGFIKMPYVGPIFPLNSALLALLSQSTYIPGSKSWILLVSTLISIGITASEP